MADATSPETIESTEASSPDAVEIDELDAIAGGSIKLPPTVEKLLGPTTGPVSPPG